MGGPDRGDDQGVIQRTLDMGGCLLLLCADDEVIGTSWISSDGRRLYLHHFGIRPHWQGNGWSKKLMQASMDFVKKSGMQVKLEVHQKNEIAIRLYTKAGFKYLGEYDVYIVRKPGELE